MKGCHIMLHLTANNFASETASTNFLVIVMFYANWCSKCAMMKPIAESMERKYRSQIKFCKVDIDESPSLSNTYEIDIIPTFVFLKNGQIEASFCGIIDETVFEQRIKKIFRNC